MQLGCPGFQKTAGVSKGENFDMLAWLLALLYLDYASLVSAAPEPNIQQVLPMDILSVIISKGGIATVCQTVYVSRTFSSLASPVTKARYSIQHGGKFYLNYTSILRELGVLVHDAKAKHGEDKAGAALQSCPDYVLSRSILAAEFGYCISHLKGYLVTFSLEELPFDTLNDGRKISALPYVLDKNLEDPRCVHFIRGLAELGRSDLLGQMTFAAITTGCFCELMSLSLPESVIQAAAEALQKNVAAAELPSVLFWAGLGGQGVLPSDGCRLPLFALQYFPDEAGLNLESCEFTGGLEGASISFWMHVLSVGTERAQRLLRLALEQGDDESKCLARAFLEQGAGETSCVAFYEQTVPTNLTDLQRDVYQAVLIHLYFDPTHRRYGVKSCGARLGSRLKMGFHTISACLDCGQSGLLNPEGFSVLSPCQLEAIAEKMYRLWEGNDGMLLRSCIAELSLTPRLLKHLVMRRADGHYNSLVWDSIQSRDRPGSLDFYFCRAPLDVLESILFGQALSVNNVTRMLGMLKGFKSYGYTVTEREHVLYTAMFWEAPEEIVDGLLSRFPGYSELDFEVVWSLLRLARYTRAFCQKLVWRCGPLAEDERTAVLEARPDLATGLGFSN